MSTAKPLLPGMLLLAAWGLVFVLLIPMAFILGSDSLGFSSQSLHLLYCLPVFVCSIWYFRSSATAWRQSFDIGWARKLPAAIALVFAVSLLALQFIPSYLDGSSTNDSPFDHRWFSVEQTCFGYPFAVIRILAQPEPPVGRWIVDFGSLWDNLMFLSVLVSGAITGLNIFRFFRDRRLKSRHSVAGNTTPA